MDSKFESLSKIAPLAPGQMIGKSPADARKILGTAPLLVRHPIRLDRILTVASQGQIATRTGPVVEIDLVPLSTAPSGWTR
jgi:hypothetical protein